MTEFVVLFNQGTSTVTIAHDGYEPTDGSISVGSFEMGVDRVNSQTASTELRSENGDHPFIVKAREVFEEAGYSGDMNTLTFVDKASNAALHPEDTPTLDALPESEPGTDPDASSQKGGLVSTVDTDPETTEANGVTEKTERADEGAKDQTSEQPGGDAQKAKAKEPDAAQGGKSTDKSSEEKGKSPGSASPKK